ncbi:transcriptional regulator ATRX homolog isoform X2 [Ptychodera flava]|uniref:transcriptional regulator ATRX homolog isoform X2 n=1 Tax=Ptychodera flava TaxID=63121 RepID=UPI00396A404F
MPVVKTNDKAKLKSTQRGETDVRQRDAKLHDKYGGNVDSFERKVANEGSVRVNEKLSRSEKRERVQQFSNLKLQDNSEVKSNKNETKYTEGFEVDKHISTKDGGREVAFQNDASTSSGKLKDLPRASQQGKSQEPAPRGASPDSNGKEKSTSSVPDQRESNERVHAGNTEQRDRKTEKKEHTHDERNQSEICEQDDTERENVPPQTFDNAEGTANNKTSKTDVTSEEKRIKENVEVESFLNATEKASEPHRLLLDIITGQFGKQSQDLLSLMSIIAAGRTEMTHESISEAPDSHKPTARSFGASPKRDQRATGHDTTFDISSTKDKRDSSHEGQGRDGATVEKPEKEAIFGDAEEKQKATKLLQELFRMINPGSSQALEGLAPKASSHGDVTEPEGAPSEKVRSCENTISPSTEKEKTDDHDIQKTTLPGDGNDGNNRGNDKRRNENKPDEDTPKGYFQLPNQNQGQIGKENEQRPIIQHFHFHGQNIQIGNHNLVKHVKKIYNEFDQHVETETDQNIDLEEDDEEMVQSTQLDEEVILSDVEDCEPGNEQNISETASQTQTAMDAKTSMLQAKDSTSLMKSKGM